MEAAEKMYEICLRLTTKTAEQRYWRGSGVFIVNSEQISHIVLVFPWRRSGVFFVNIVLWFKKLVLLSKVNWPEKCKEFANFGSERKLWATSGTP